MQGCSGSPWVSAKYPDTQQHGLQLIYSWYLKKGHEMAASKPRFTEPLIIAYLGKYCIYLNEYKMALI
jgi:hypothetical protein